MFKEIEETVKSKFDEYGKPILSDLQELAKKYGAWIVLGIAALFIWKMLKNKG